MGKNHLHKILNQPFSLHLYAIKTKQTDPTENSIQYPKTPPNPILMNPTASKS